jgi:PhnB protein
MTKLHIYLNFAGTAEEAFEFYRSVFGGEFSSLVRFDDMPMEGVDIPDEDGKKIMHISLPIGDDNILMASDTLESLGQQLRPGNNAYVSVHPTSREEADRIFRTTTAKHALIVRNSCYRE